MQTSSEGQSLHRVTTALFQNVRRTVSDRRDANGGLCHAELGSASRCEEGLELPIEASSVVLDP
jgi:hypothetical protein